MAVIVKRGSGSFRKKYVIRNEVKKKSVLLTVSFTPGADNQIIRPPLFAPSLFIVLVAAHRAGQQGAGGTKRRLLFCVSCLVPLLTRAVGRAPQEGRLCPAQGVREMSSDRWLGRGGRGWAFRAYKGWIGLDCSDWRLVVLGRRWVWVEKSSVLGD